MDGIEYSSRMPKDITISNAMYDVKVKGNGITSVVVKESDGEERELELNQEVRFGAEVVSSLAQRR